MKSPFSPFGVDGDGGRVGLHPKKVCQQDTGQCKIFTTTCMHILVVGMTRYQETRSFCGGVALDSKGKNPQ